VTRLSSIAQYALLAATDLAANYESEGPVKAGDIARRTGAPVNYLGQILLRLKTRALVRSTRGPRGGYRLMRRPELISVAEVLDAVASDDDRRRNCVTVDECRAAALEWLSDEMDAARRRLLSRVTLADFARRASPD
jgi:Rrf2 family iron-sulfur cluster assembly transcriptional regulator